MSQTTVMLNICQSRTADQSLIAQYFESLNSRQFDRTAALFEEDGYLYPPFDGAIRGREGIKNYLQKEFNNFFAQPQEILKISSDQEESEYLVYGEVVNSLFSVRVSWSFHVNHRHELNSVRVKLLASLKELLNLAPAHIKESLPLATESLS